MTCYKYKPPLDNGYVKVDVERKEWNKNFPRNCGFTCLEYVDVYYHPKKDCFYIERYYRGWAKMAQIVFFPIDILLSGLVHYKDTIKNTKGVVFQRKNGTFTTFMVYSGTENYWKIKRCLKWWNMF